MRRLKQPATADTSITPVLAEFWGVAPEHGAASAPGALSPESWADVAWMGGPADRSVGMTGGEAVGGEDDCGGADGDDAGAAMRAAGSRADVMAAGSRAAQAVLRAMGARCQAEGVVFQGAASTVRRAAAL